MLIHFACYPYSMKTRCLLAFSRDAFKVASIISIEPASQIFKAVSLLRDFSQKDCVILRHNNRPSLPADIVT